MSLFVSARSAPNGSLKAQGKIISTNDSDGAKNMSCIIATLRLAAPGTREQTRVAGSVILLIRDVLVIHG
jgi:hypothetical protein